MLDDERARDLVAAETPPATRQSLSTDARAELGASIDACEQAVVGYEALSRLSGSEKIASFAANRFAARWKMLAEIRQSADPGAQDSIKVKAVGNDVIDVSAAASPALDTIVDRDKALEERLLSAFSHDTTPAWKAKMAEWISNIRSDQTQISWLTSVINRRNRKNPSNSNDFPLSNLNLCCRHN